MKQFLKLSVFSTLLLVGGCAEVKTQLGLDRHTPDEFSVMQRAPLEIPADLTTLPTPQPGMARPQDVTAKQQANKAIFGTEDGSAPNLADNNAKPSASENNLINKVGGHTTDAQIRQKIAAEKDMLEEDNRPVVKRLLGIGSDTVGQNVVDAEAEAKRIIEARKAGKPLNEGETPSIKD